MHEPGATDQLRHPLTYSDESSRLIYMSQRLQVLLDEEEFAEIRRVARRHRMTVAEWVRQALRQARSGESTGDARQKLAVVRESAAHSYPAPDIEQMLAEIERGYVAGESQ
jgi:transposase-like protein